MKLAYFQGFVVTCNDDNTIPVSARVIGEPITLETKAQMDKVAVDRIWLVKTINEYEATVKRHNDRIVELLEEKKGKDASGA